MSHPTAVISRSRTPVFSFWFTFCSTLIVAASLGATEVPWSTANVIGDAFAGATSVFAADIDGDGDTDVVGGAANGTAISWWENTAGDGTAWTKRTIDGGILGPTSVSVADVDGDGDSDVLGTGFGDGALWWENTVGDGLAWTEHTIDPAAYLGTIIAADVDGDGDIDVLGAAWSANDITWWENQGGQFALPTTDGVTSANPVEGTTDVLVLTIGAAHRGRTGDAGLEIVTFELLFEEAPGDPLTDGELTDSADGVCDADCSLREAIIAANAAPGKQLIMLNPGTYELSLAGTGEDLCLTCDLDITDSLLITAADPSLTTIDGNQIDRIFDVAANTTGVTFSNITITGGLEVDGAGLLSGSGSETFIANCNVTENSASHWGGGILHSGSFMEVANSTVSDNIADTAGGGILACCEASNELMISGSTQSGNSGGGLRTNVITGIVNSTFSENTLDFGVIAANATTMTNTTVFGNDAGGVAVGSPGNVDLVNSVVQGCIFPGVTSLGGNIESPGDSCALTGTGDQTNVSPANLAIGALAANGGSTQTMALTEGSVATDTALAANCPSTDQRGTLRPQGVGCDVGACEIEALIPFFADGFESGNTSGWSSVAQ